MAASRVPGRKPPISIRQSLLRNVLLLTLLLSGAILATTLVVAERSIDTLSRAAMRAALAEVSGALQGFFEPVHDGLSVTSAWGRAGLLDLDDPQRLNRAFEPLLRAQPQISSEFHPSGEPVI